MTRPRSAPAPTSPAAALPTARGAAPVLRLVPFAFAQAFGRPPAGVWSAPYVLRLSGSRAGPGTAVALSWRVVVAAAPRADGVLRVGSIDRPEEGVEFGPAGDIGPVPDWARPVLAGTTGAGGLDLLVHTDLPDSTGLSASVPLSRTAALIEAAFHDPAAGGGRRARARLTDPPLGTVALSARPGHLMLIEDAGGEPTPVPFDPDRLGLRFVLAVPRRVAGDVASAEPADRTAADRSDRPTPPARAALAAGAIEARPLGAGGSTIAVVPGAALASVRRALVTTYTRAGEPAPRVLSASVGSPCTRVA
ncbi:hypothetical protein [Embleya scabrispora]|uniref:hypothetical protein n=1 Tax=Embleya scabrispora TaxID=159449 RepID=UPI0003A40343|nr:hypothetical protein [Embleya scabrispora]MYS85664.1 hypothetical protein [Streptomyces sp. SID5474]